MARWDNMIKKYNREYLKWIWRKAKEKCISIYGKKEYENKYKAAIKQELGDLSKYQNGPDLIYTMAVINENVVKKIDRSGNKQKNLSFNGCAAYVNGRFGQSVVLFLLGLTGYDWVRKTENRMPFYGGWAFKNSYLGSTIGPRAPVLYIEMCANSNYIDAFKDVLSHQCMLTDSLKPMALVPNKIYGRNTEPLLPSMTINEYGKKLSDFADRCKSMGLKKDDAITEVMRTGCGMLGTSDEYKVGEHLVLKKNENLEMLALLEEKTGVPTTEIGCPFDEDVIVMDCEIPREKYSSSVKWMFREDLYDLLHIQYPLLSDESIYYLVEKIRQNSSDKEERIQDLKYIGRSNDAWEKISEVRYLPLKTGFANRFYTMWRLEQYRKKFPEIYNECI